VVLDCGQQNIPMINLGVSGHRFLLEESKIVQGIKAALDAIEAAFGSPPFRVVSQLAEGADRLAVKQILKRENSKLLVPLPLPLDDYLTDFLDPASRADFYSLYGQPGPRHRSAHFFG